MRKSGKDIECNYRRSNQMIPTKQTKFKKDGNCLEACIASILGISIDSIPCLGQYEQSGNWISKLNKWLSKHHGLVYVETNTSIEDIKVFFEQQPGGFYHVIIGKTHRSKEMYHAVVGRCGEMVFDPAPDEGGLLPPRTHLRIGMFIKTFLDI